MMGALGYVRPGTLAEALDFLREHGPRTEILAGGTDVMIDLRAGVLRSKRYLLDVSRLDDLKGITAGPDGISVGAGVAIAEIGDSELLREHAPTLWQCAQTFASQQVRNAATIGGNAAHCSPCGDTLPPLVIHDARAVLSSKDGRREVPVDAIASGPYACSLPSHELIERFILEPAPEITFSDFQKTGRRKALAIARISMAAMARQEADGTVAFFRFSLGACTPTPRRMAVVEAMVAGRRPTETLLREAASALTEEMFRVTGRRASAVYKEPAVQGLFLRMLYPMVRS
jgi:CO/xanthine dehydrogenase FAD-binding subunit